tara:strand:+ start:1236 stop:1739 length:504 start_codon:yes stop_codon:yes gene_type:complete
MNTPISQIQQVVRLTLFDMGMHSESAERLIMGTGAVESKFKYLMQVGGSNLARSWFQIEPETGIDNIVNYLKYRKSKWAKIQHTTGCPDDMIDMDFKTTVEEGKMIWTLTTNISFAVAMCRIKYWRVPKRLPKVDDVEGMGKYWLKYYNAGGKGSMDKWMEAQELLK